MAVIIAATIVIRSEGGAMKFQVEEEWEGWEGDTIVKLTDGSVWRQDEYHYEYVYAFMPTVNITNNMMMVDGMSKPIRVRRID